MRVVGGVEGCAGWEVGGIGLSGGWGRGRSSAAMVAKNIIQSCPIPTQRTDRSALASNYDLFNNKKMNIQVFVINEVVTSWLPRLTGLSFE